MIISSIFIIRQRKADIKNNSIPSTQEDIIKIMLNYEIDKLKDENDPSKRMTGGHKMELTGNDLFP